MFSLSKLSSALVLTLAVGVNRSQTLNYFQPADGDKNAIAEDIRWLVKAILVGTAKSSGMHIHFTYDSVADKLRRREFKNEISNVPTLTDSGRNLVRSEKVLDVASPYPGGVPR